MNHKETLIAWLNDAHAMEHALIKVLEHRIEDAKDFPAVQEMDRQHLEQTRRHAELVKGCIERLGEKPSTAKSVMGTIFGAAQAPMTGLARDEIVKNCLMDYAAENFEVASYRALITAANQLGDSQTVLICEQIMQEDLEMANRILDGLPAVVAQQMQKVAAGASVS